MSALFLPGLKSIGCLAIAVVTLWLGGLGCVLCCSAGVVDSCCAGEQNTYSRQAPSITDCCKRVKKSCASAVGDSISQPPDAGCSLLPNQTPVLLRGPSATSLPADVIPVNWFLPEPDITLHAPVYSASILPANRGSTYLRRCVLLI